MNNDSGKSYNFGADLRRRISQTKTTRWIRFAIVSVIFLLWVAWLGNWWVALFLFLLFASPLASQEEHSRKGVSIRDLMCFATVTKMRLR